MNVVNKGIVTLLRSGITGEKLMLPEEFSLESAFEILRRQSVVPLAYQGAINCGIPKDNPVMQQMLMIYYKSLLIHEHQMKAVNQIFDAFETHGIAHMPVKGCNLKGLYPKPELRVMGDVDILIHPEDYERIRPVMESLGFAFFEENDHVFVWNSDALLVELHKSLVPPNNEDYYAYYGSGWRLAVKKSGYRYDLSDEDAYLFMFTHFARHYRRSGIGCRHVVDLYLYRKSFCELDEKYIHQELLKLHLLEFHENIMRLLDVWFAGCDPDPITELISTFVFSGGNWGSREAKIYSAEVKEAKRTGKIKFAVVRSMVRSIFLPLDQMSSRYEPVKKHPVLLPAFWVVRWLNILFIQPRKIKRRIGILRMINDQNVLDYHHALQAVGLEFHFGENSIDANQKQCQ